MALARVKVVNPGDTILSADWNNEFNNILNNPISLVSPTTGAINFQTSVAHTNLNPTAIAASSGGTQWGLYGVRGLQGTVTSSFTATFAADAYTYQTTNKTTLGIVAATSAFTIQVSTSQGTSPGAGFRDTASTFSSTGQWVYLYGITTGAGSTAPAGIASLTGPPTGPTLPSGYSGWCPLGAAWYSTNTAFLPLRIRGAAYQYELGAASTARVLSAGVSTSFASVSLANFVPPGSNYAKLVTTLVYQSSGGGILQLNANLRVTGSPSAAGDGIGSVDATSSVSGQAINVLDYPVSTSGALDYALDSTKTGGGGGTGLYIDVLGYRVSNGDF